VRHDEAMHQPRVVMMGVAGSGKTTVGRLVAQGLQVPFVDADDLHSPGAIAKMHAGAPLTEDDRRPWLLRCRTALLQHDHGVVLACSALTAAARGLLTEGVDDVCFVHLVGSPSIIAERLGERADHFAGLSLLPSQLFTLQPPEGAVTLDVSDPPEVVAARAIEQIRARTVHEAP
jgi:gluconokinase